MFFHQKYFSFVFLSLSFLNLFDLSAEESVQKAVAVIHSTQGNHAQGVVVFKTVKDGISIVVDLDGLKPGEHGFHIHEFGDCSLPDASSAGGHFNPTKKKHGSPLDADHHLGDLGNVVADEKGHVHFEVVNREIKFEGPNSIIGRSIIVHEGKDDFVSQPAGNSGARIGCGVIGISSDR